MGNPQTLRLYVYNFSDLGSTKRTFRSVPLRNEGLGLLFIFETLPFKVRYLNFTPAVPRFQLIYLKKTQLKPIFAEGLSLKMAGELLHLKEQLFDWGKQSIYM